MWTALIGQHAASHNELPLLPTVYPDKALESNVDEALAYARPLFNGADADNDGQLTLKEYAAFMHPELHLRMIDVLVDTFLEQFDNNDDGYVSFFEYMGKTTSCLC